MKKKRMYPRNRSVPLSKRMMQSILWTIAMEKESDVLVLIRLLYWRWLGRPEDKVPKVCVCVVVKNKVVLRGPKEKMMSLWRVRLAGMGSLISC